MEDNNISLDVLHTNACAGGVAERSKAADCKSAGFPYAGSNPAPSTKSVAFKAKFKYKAVRSNGCWDLFFYLIFLSVSYDFKGIAHIAQLVEHFLGKEEVTGSSPVMSSIKYSF